MVPRPKWTAQLGLDRPSAWHPRRVPLPRADAISRGWTHSRLAASPQARCRFGLRPRRPSRRPRSGSHGRAWVVAKVSRLQPVSVGQDPGAQLGRKMGTYSVGHITQEKGALRVGEPGCRPEVCLSPRG